MSYTIVVLKTFLSTMWDLYFMWRFDLKKSITPDEYIDLIKEDLDFVFAMGSPMPDIKEPVNDLFSHLIALDQYYSCNEKIAFVEKYYNSICKQ